MNDTWDDGTPKSSGNAFTYWKDGAPSLLLQELGNKNPALRRARATEAVEKARADGREPASIYGLSRRSAEAQTLFRQLRMGAKIARRKGEKNG